MIGTTTARLAAAALAAILGIAAAPGAALADTFREEVNLAPAPETTALEAAGSVDAKETGKGRTLKISVKKLEPKRLYEVRRGGEVIDTLKTNRKGKGSVKIKEDLPPPPAPEPEPAPQHLQFNWSIPGALDGGTGGGDPSRGDGSGNGYGYGYYYYYFDWYAYDWYGYEDPGQGDDDRPDDNYYGYDWYGYGDPGHGGGYFPPDYYGYIPYYIPPYWYCYDHYGYEEPTEEEPCPCDWYCVEVYDAETGECVLECSNECHDDDAAKDGEGDEEPPCEMPVLEDYAFGWADYCGEDGSYASCSMNTATYEGAPYEDFYFSFLVPEQSDCWWTNWLYFEFYANETTGLPLGVETLADLQGRAFEVRNADGAAVLGGNLPTLEAYGDLPWFGPAPSEETRPGIEGDAGGYTLWIADAEGTLQEAGDLLVPDYGYYYPTDGSDDGSGTNGGGFGTR